MIGLYSQIPRTGSTVITGLFQQRPDVYMPVNSPIIQLFWEAQALWGHPSWRVELSDPSIFYGRVEIIRGMIEGFTKTVAPKKLWIDKHWNWASPANIKTIREYFPEIKMFRTVRDWGEIEKSFIKLEYKYSEQKLKSIEEAHDALNLSDNNLLTVDFSRVKNDLPSVMKDLEHFLEIPKFDYNFKKISLDTSILDDLTSPALHKLRKAA
tara:strand:- start:743 stop:1372 length:630 start_codon:yes stop_codon:yes gene_type:complete